MKTLMVSLRLALPALALTLGSTVLYGLRAEDWTLEDVLFKVEEANGGLKAIESTTNVRVRGKVHTEDIVYEFLLLKKRPDKVRIHLMHQGRSVETGFDGTTGWRRIWQGNQDMVRPLTPAELASSNLDLDFDGPLIGPVLPGTTRSFAGIERIDRVDYFLIDVETALSRTRHYIDSRNFREWKTVRRILEDGVETAVVETIYSQYRRYGTIWLAGRVERILPGGKRELIEIQDAEVDPGLLDRVFAMPKQWASGS